MKLVFSAVVMLLVPAFEWGAQPAISHSLVIENPVAPLGGTIFAELIVKNNGAESVFYGVSPDVRVVFVSGEEVQKSDWYVKALKMNSDTSGWSSGIAPGQVKAFPVEVTRYYTVTKSGRYRLSIGADEAEFTVVDPGSASETRLESSIQPLAKIAPAEYRKISINFGQPTLSITQHEPIRVALEMKNLTGSELALSMDSQAESGYRVSVLNPSGRRTDVFSVPEGIAYRYDTLVKIGAGDTLKKSVLLSRWYPFEEVGHYRVAFYLPEAQEPAIVDVEVGPRDARKLEGIAKELAGEIQSGNRWDAMMALSSMRDEVAVRSLRNYRDKMGIGALVLMDREDAAHEIGLMVGDRDRHVADSAREALQSLKKESKSAIVRQAAERELK